MPLSKYSQFGPSPVGLYDAIEQVLGHKIEWAKYDSKPSSLEKHSPLIDAFDKCQSERMTGKGADIVRTAMIEVRHFGWCLDGKGREYKFSRNVHTGQIHTWIEVIQKFYESRGAGQPVSE